MSPAFADSLIAEGRSLDAARSVVIEALMARNLPDAGPRRGPSGVTHSSAARVEDFRQAAADALCLGAGIVLRTPHPAARDLRGTSVVELAKISLSPIGERVPAGGPTAILQRAGAMTTSDFPGILGDSLATAIRVGYTTEPASHRQCVRVASVADFRTQVRPILGSAPDLKLVLEHGEYTRGLLGEEAASYAVQKWGRVVALTWEVLVNDQLDAFLRIQPTMGQAARRAEADAVYALFSLNSGNGPTMPDGFPLFDATNHHNVTAAQDTLDAAALGAGRTLLRRQTALGGGYLNLVPASLLVSPEWETIAEQLLAAATRAVTSTTDAATPEWIGSLTLVVDPRLTINQVYLVASSSQIDSVELGVPEENLNGPTLDSRTGFDIDMMEYKCRHVFGPKALDYRGMVKIPITTAPGLLVTSPPPPVPEPRRSRWRGAGARAKRRPAPGLSPPVSSRSALSPWGAGRAGRQLR